MHFKLKCVNRQSLGLGLSSSKVFLGHLISGQNGGLLQEFSLFALVSYQLILTRQTVHISLADLEADQGQDSFVLTYKIFET